MSDPSTSCTVSVDNILEDVSHFSLVYLHFHERVARMKAEISELRTNMSAWL